MDSVQNQKLLTGFPTYLVHFFRNLNHKDYFPWSQQCVAALLKNSLCKLTALSLQTVISAAVNILISLELHCHLKGDH